MKNRSAVAVLAISLAISMSACDGSSPTQPDTDVDASATAAPTPTSTPVPTDTPIPAPSVPAACHPDGRLQATIRDDGKTSGKAKVRVTNSSSDCTYPFTWVSYNMPTGRLEDQTVYDHKSVTVRPGERVDLTIDVPACSYQLDGPIREDPLVPPFYDNTWPGTRYLTAYAQISRGSCTPTPNPSPTPTPNPSPTPTPNPSPTPTPSPSPTPTPSPSPTPPPRTCTDINVQGSARVTGTSATVSSNWNGSGTGTIKLDGGAAQSIGNGGSATYNGLSYGDHVAVITVVEGRLSCTKTVTFTIRRPTCADYTPPPITGDIGVVPGATQYTFNSGTVGPPGGNFSPSLPQTVNRPNYGQPAGSFSTEYTLPYGPEDLQCKTRKTFTKRVPPKDPTCGEQNPPSASFQGYSDSGGNLSGTVRLQNAGGWTVYMYSTSTEAKCNANQADYEKVKHPVQQACGSSTNDTVTYHWEGHSSEWWWVAWTNSGTPSAGGRSSCKQNTHNPN